MMARVVNDHRLAQNVCTLQVTASTPVMADADSFSYRGRPLMGNSITPVPEQPAHNMKFPQSSKSKTTSETSSLGSILRANLGPNRSEDIQPVLMSELAQVVWAEQSFSIESPPSSEGVVSEGESIEIDTDRSLDSSYADPAPGVITRQVMPRGPYIYTKHLDKLGQGHRDWSSGLFDFGDNYKSCVISSALPMYQLYELAKEVDEDVWTLYFLGPCICWPPFLCIPIPYLGVTSLRTKIRLALGIQGSLRDDCTQVACCYPLTLAQMVREVKNSQWTMTT